MKRLAALALALLLSGCAGSAALGPTLSGVTGQIPGQAAGLFGIPAATISQQMVAEIAGLQPVVTQFQMLKAQLDGASIALPPFPGTPLNPGAPVVINPPPVVVNPPGGPIVTPNARARRHASLDRQSVDQAVYDHAPARDTPAMGPGPSGVPDQTGAQTGKPANFQFECSSSSCAICSSSGGCATPQPARGGILTPPSDLRSLFGPDGHLRPSAMVQTADP